MALDFNHAVLIAHSALKGGLGFPDPLESFQVNGLWCLRNRDGSLICEVSREGTVVVPPVARNPKFPYRVW
jgi:hypothetical protein